MLRKCTLLATIAIAAATPAFAMTINTVETTVASGTAGITLDNNPVIDYIATQPGTLDGYTYSSYAIIAHDATGSLELYGKLPAGSSYVPTVGDALTVTGTYSPYSGIPELASMTAITANSSGNAVLAPKVVTIPGINASASTPDYSISEYLVELDNVTLTNTDGSAAPANFPVHANTTLAAWDSDGNSVKVYQWASSYAASALLGGTAIPTTAVNMTGIVSSYNGTAEFIPFTVTAVATPEPASLSALALGGVALLARRRR